VKNKLIFSFIFIISINFSVYASANLPFKNIIIHKKPISYEEIVFIDYDENKINLSTYNNEIYILNFWATWCLPCKKEMPSLDKLYNKYKKIKIFPINIDNKDKYKSQTFFRNLEIKNLSIYFDANSNLAKLFRLQGIPTTVILNSKREEIARILGEIDFSDKKFINWIKEINNASY
tara:strand:- start:574 stop:1104 length:531 start_codon:yes stop_codon:yes gene_type:complete